MGEYFFTQTYDAASQEKFLRQLEEGELEEALQTIGKFLRPSEDLTEKINYLLAQRDAYKMLAKRAIIGTDDKDGKYTSVGSVRQVNDNAKELAELRKMLLIV